MCTKSHSRSVLHTLWLRLPQTGTGMQCTANARDGIPLTGRTQSGLLEHRRFVSGSKSGKLLLYI